MTEESLSDERGHILMPDGSRIDFISWEEFKERRAKLIGEKLR